MILLIEDEMTDAHALGEMLNQACNEKFDIKRASGLSEGLEWLTNHPVDLVLLDLSLPDSQGLETFNRLYSRALHLPVIVLSCIDDEALAIQAVRAGAQDYLVKGCIEGSLLVRSIRYAYERKHTQELLQENQRMLYTLMSNLPGMAYRCKNDRNWTMEFVSQGCCELTGFSPDDLILNQQVAYATLIHPEDRQQVWDCVQVGVVNRVPFRLTYRIYTNQGQEKWVWEQGRGVYSETGDLLALEGFITDITERKNIEQAAQEQRRRAEELATENARLYEEMKRLADTDDLTGLVSRRQLLSVGKGIFERSRRYHHTLSMIMIDVDQFKNVNDYHGHIVGDQTLVALAKRFLDNVRAADILGRYAGDEFLIVMPDTDLEQASCAAERLRKKVEAEPFFTTEAGYIRLTVSLGVVQYNHGSDLSLIDLMKRVDVALYQAKTNGRNCVALG